MWDVFFCGAECIVDVVTTDGPTYHTAFLGIVGAVIGGVKTGISAVKGIIGSGKTGTTTSTTNAPALRIPSPAEIGAAIKAAVTAALPKVDELKLPTIELKAKNQQLLLVGGGVGIVLLVLLLRR